MISALIAAFAVTIPSWVIIRTIERQAEILAGGRIAFWKRMSIPAPIVCLLAANLNDLISLAAYVQAHPRAIVYRDGHERTWETECLFYVGLVFVLVLPFILAKTPRQGFRLAPVVWGAHFFWMLFPFAPLLLATGVPFQD